MFDFKGLMMIERDDGIDEDELLLHALEAGAEDVQTSEDGLRDLYRTHDFTAVRDELEGQGYVFLSAERQKIPQTMWTSKMRKPLKVMKLLRCWRTTTTSWTFTTTPTYLRMRTRNKFISP